MDRSWLSLGGQIMTATPAQIGLSALCGVLLLGIAYETTAPQAQFAVPQIAMGATATPANGVRTFIAPQPSPFNVINDRPVFSPTRKPIAPAPVGPAAAPPPPPTASLIGVILDGQSRLALVKTPSSPLETSVGVGGNVGGWQVTQILPDRIVLQLGTAEEIIKLESNRAKEEPTQKRDGFGPMSAPPPGPAGGNSAAQGTVPAETLPSGATAPNTASFGSQPNNPVVLSGTPSNGTDKHN